MSSTRLRTPRARRFALAGAVAAVTSLVALGGLATANAAEPPGGPGGSRCSEPTATVKASGSNIVFTGTVACNSPFTIGITYGQNAPTSGFIKNCVIAPEGPSACGIKGVTKTVADKSGSQKWCAFTTIYMGGLSDSGKPTSSVYNSKAVCINH